MVTQSGMNAMAHFAQIANLPVSKQIVQDANKINKAVAQRQSQQKQNTQGLTTTTEQTSPAPAPYVPPDPYARWGGQDSYNRLVDGFDKQKDTIFSTSRDAAENSGISMRNSILDLLDSVRTGQRTIDNRGVNNELAKQRGTSDVYGSVNRGIRSAGVTLANKNASDSSAAGAFARAYGDIGRRQLSDIGNEYALENVEIGDAQVDLDRQRAGGLRRIEGTREQAVNTIVSEANNKLAALDAAMAEADLPERIAIDTEKNRIRSEVLSKLSQYDNSLGKINEVKAMGLNPRIAEATRRAALGLSPEAQFDFTDEMPEGIEGTGPVSSELPIFTYRSREE